MNKSSIDFRLTTLEDMLIAKFDDQGHLNDYAMEHIAGQLFDKNEINQQIKDKIITIINKTEGKFNDTKCHGILRANH